MMVGTERLELSHLAALEPKSSASTNFATSPSGYQLSVGFLSYFGRGSRIRTLTNGFGDRHATITPILYFHPIFSSQISIGGAAESRTPPPRPAAIPIQCVYQFRHVPNGCVYYRDHFQLTSRLS